jgi:hypothetical protein
MLFNNENLGPRANIDGNLVPKRTVISVPIAATTTSLPVFIANDDYIVEGVTVTFGTASTSGTLQLEKCTGTTALASGTNLLTGTVSLAGTANTPVSGTLVSNPITLSLASGNRLNVILAGTMTNLATAVVTVYLKRALTGVTS